MTAGRGDFPAVFPWRKNDEKFYGAGSTLEVFDAETLKSRKVLYLNKDTTTNLIVMAGK